MLGSAGRGESLLAMDQDNALIFAEGEPDGVRIAGSRRLGAHVADILHEVGVPYCKGGVMAKNPQWRGSVATWRERIGDWIERSSPQDLLSVDIFFDLRGVHGDGGLADRLRRAAFDAADGQVAFAKLLAEVRRHDRARPQLLRRFRTDEGRIDLKKAGLFGIVTAARALAIRHHVMERSTPARLAGIKALGLGGGTRSRCARRGAGRLSRFAARSADRGYRTRRARVECCGHKAPSQRDRDRLRSALHSVTQLDQMTQDLLFKN